MIIIIYLYNNCFIQDYSTMKKLSFSAEFFPHITENILIETKQFSVDYVSSF